MKPRIALVTHETSGGLASMVLFLHRALELSGRYEPDIVVLATSASDTASVLLRSPMTWRRGIQVRRISWNGLEYTHVGAWGSELEPLRYQPRCALSELLSEYDLLQFVVGSAVWARVAFRVPKPILVWTATTTRADRASRARTGSLIRQIWAALMLPLTEAQEGRALRRAHRVFALSQYTANALRSMMGAKRSVLAPCGIDTRLFRPLQLNESGEDGNKYLLCVARLSDARKNVPLLLRAYALLRAQVGDEAVPDLHLVGEAPSDMGLALLSELGLTGRVRFLGPKRGDELASLYRNASFFVLSSDEEGLAIVLLEAMASGLAVVSTACGGPEMIVSHGTTGLLTPVGDASALAQAMKQLLQDSEIRQRMGQAGCQFAQENFSIAAASQVFLDEYDRLLEYHPTQ